MAQEEYEHDFAYDDFYDAPSADFPNINDIEDAKAAMSLIDACNTRAIKKAKLLDIVRSLVQAGRLNMSADDIARLQFLTKKEICIGLRRAIIGEPGRAQEDHYRQLKEETKQRMTHAHNEEELNNIARGVLMANPEYSAIIDDSPRSHVYWFLDKDGNLITVDRKIREFRPDELLRINSGKHLILWSS